MNYPTLNSEIIKAKKSGILTEDLTKTFISMSYDFMENTILPNIEGSMSEEDKHELRHFVLSAVKDNWSKFDPTRFTSPKKYVFTIMKSALANWVNRRLKNRENSYIWTSRVTPINKEKK